MDSCGESNELNRFSRILDGEEDKFLEAFIAGVSAVIDEDNDDAMEDARLQQNLANIPNILQAILTEDDSAEVLNQFMHKFFTIGQDNTIVIAPPPATCLKLNRDFLFNIDASEVSINANCH